MERRNEKAIQEAFRSEPAEAAQDEKGEVGAVVPKGMVLKPIERWKQIHLRRLELVLYQYSLGIVTSGTVAEELRLLKMLDDIEAGGEMAEKN